MCFLTFRVVEIKYSWQLKRETVIAARDQCYQTGRDCSSRPVQSRDIPSVPSR